jgi:hypothetical protein
MDAPLYDIGDVVYLRESAAIGHLEAVTISGATYRESKWMYAIRAGRAQPSSVPYYGDRISAVNAKTLYFTESELVVLCDALLLAEANAQRALERIQLQRANLCPDVTE